MNTRTRIASPGRRLALLGGQPAFARPVHVGRPNLGSRERFLEYANRIFDQRWLTNGGPHVLELEQRLGQLLGVRHVVATCNATAALEIAIRALGLQGEVILPSFTFAATAHALQWLGIAPVFADIDPRTHTIDPRCVERLISPRTTGILGVHLWGRPAAVDALQSLADERNLKLFFDSAHAFGCSCRGRTIGGFGDAEVFSFHATKFFNTGEGGAIATNDDELARRIRLMRNFGFAGYDNVLAVGINGKMSELAAALGLTNLETLDGVVAVNRRNYAAYGRELAGQRGLSLVRYDESERCNFQYLAVENDAAVTGIQRDELITVLHAENILARRYFWPGCHRMPPYRTGAPGTALQLLHTEAVADRILVLPTGSAVGAADIVAICGIIHEAIARSGELRARGLLG